MLLFARQRASDRHHYADGRAATKGRGGGHRREPCLAVHRLGMANQMEKALRNRRSLEDVLAELEAKYEQNPSAELARMMEQLRAEIEARKRPPLTKK